MCVVSPTDSRKKVILVELLTPAMADFKSIFKNVAEVPIHDNVVRKKAAAHSTNEPTYRREEAEPTTVWVRKSAKTPPPRLAETRG